MNKPTRKKNKKVTLNDLAEKVGEVSTTIDDLAIMIQNGFKHMDEKFEKRFKTMDEKFDRFEARFSKIEEIVLFDHRPRIKALEDEVGI